MYNIWNFLLTHRQFTYLLMIAIVIAGFMSVFAVPKESTPEITIPIAVVVTAMPGASASEMELLVTNVLERPLKSGLENVKQITSNSREGVSSITVEFEANADLQTAMQKLRDQVNTAKAKLPTDATEPQVIQVDFAAQPVITASISANLPDPALFKLGKDVKNEIEKVQGVSSVSVGGLRDRQVQVLLRKSALAQYGLTAGAVSQAIATQNSAFPAGSVRIAGAEYPVRFAGDLVTADDIRQTPIQTAKDDVIFIGDVADVVDGYAPATTLSRTSIGGSPSQPSLSLSIFKARGSNITDVSSAVSTRLKELQAPGQLLENAKAVVSYDEGNQIFNNLSELARSGILATVLVVLLLTLTVGWREALIAGSSIPLSLLATFSIMKYTGNSLNVVSLFSLVLAIGIIVDTAVVIVDGINVRIREEDLNDPEAGVKAAQKALAEYHRPLTAGTMTTIAVFAPLFLVTGIIGQFIKSIPFTVIGILLASLLVSLGFVPLIGARFAKYSAQHTDNFRERLVTRIRSWYRAYLTQFLEGKNAAPALLITIAIMLVMGLSLPFIGAIGVAFFEDDNGDNMYVQIEMPQGSSLAATDIEARKVEEFLYKEKDIASFVTTIGESSQFAGQDGATQDTKLANMFIDLKTNRSQTNKQIQSHLLASLADIHTSKIDVGAPSGGPPTGNPIVITFTGTDLQALEATAVKASRLLASIPGTTGVTTGSENSGTQFVISFDRAQALSQGVTARDAAQNVRASLFGSTATTLRTSEDDVDVVTRVAYNESSGDPNQSNATDPENILSTPVSGLRGGSVALGSFASLKPEQSRAVIVHKDGDRIITVSSGLALGANATVVGNTFLSRAKSELAVPEGIKMTLGGENQNINDSFSDLGIALIVGMIAIFAILVLEFNSFRHSFYVLLTVPLSLVGVLAGLLIVGRPISFPAIMGFIALSGVIVNHTIVMVDTINRIRSTDAKTDLKTAVINAAVERVRPILLTATATILGAFPLLFAAAIWVPLSIALMFGLAFATVITLALIPALYLRWPGTLGKAH